MSKISKNDWLKRFKSIHEDKYDYSLVEIVDSHTPVKIIPEKPVLEKDRHRKWDDDLF